MKQQITNRRLLISLVVLIGVTIALYFVSGVENNERPDPALFRVADLKSIDRIELESGPGKVILSYRNAQWQVNERYPADRRMIQVLFATLQQAEPRRRVAANLADSISFNLKSKGVKVSLFSGQTMMKQFVAGGNAEKTQAYFLTDEVGAHLMSIPGYRVYVSGIFELDENGFRDKYVFPFNWENFKSLKAEFPAKPVNNFEVKMNKSFFVVEGLSKTDTAKLNTYLDDVSLLTAESYLPAAIADSLDQIVPHLIITIEDVANRKYSLSLYQPQGKNKVVGLINREPANFDIGAVRPIVRPKSFFAKP